MQLTTSYRQLFAAVLFVVAFLLKAPLVDTCYRYSFEPDSEPCIEETRSFYFFFKNPSVENAPHTLTSYPNYSDGQFITSALLANIIRPLCKAGIIHTYLSDADNSLIIFSMRWTGVCFDALAAVLVFGSIVLLTGNAPVAFVICLLYYLLNLQTLPIDFIRTDHYTLFAATFAMWAGIRLYFNSHKNSSYIITGIAAGMVSATKINFPFYLVLPVLVLFLLFYKKMVRLQHTIALLSALALTTGFMYCRWLLYPENILDVIKTTFTIGEDWVKFWGTGNFTYYLWQQFFTHGASTGVVVLLALFYLSFTWCLVTGIISNRQINLLLCTAFILQMLALGLSPKVGRYGILVPVYISLFTGLLFSNLYHYHSQRTLVLTLFVLLLVPVFGTSYQNYQTAVLLRRQTQQSIAETRLPAAEWIAGKYAAGSLLAVQHPRVSNPPVFDLPLRFNYTFLEFPFLHQQALCNFLPPAIATLKATVNGIIISDKEKNYHLLTLRQQGCSPSVYVRWQNFYNSLSSYFSEKKFQSVYPNYGVKSFSIYAVNDTPRFNTISPISLTAQYQNNSIQLNWKYTYTLGANAYRFQIQIAEDSAMQWLVYGSRDGYISKYRTQGNPAQIQNNNFVFTPPAVLRALHRGKFNHITGGHGAKEMDAEFENFFAAILINMKNNNLTFGESMKQLLHGEEEAFVATIQPLYKSKGNIYNMHLKQYLSAAELTVNENNINSEVTHHTTWQFTLPCKLPPHQTFYCRVRFRDNVQLSSEWSNVLPIVTN